VASSSGQTECIAESLSSRSSCAQAVETCSNETTGRSDDNDDAGPSSYALVDLQHRISSAIASSNYFPPSTESALELIRSLKQIVPESSFAEEQLGLIRGKTTRQAQLMIQAGNLEGARMLVHQLNPYFSGASELGAPRLGCVTLEKLYRAGLGSLDALFLANKEDLAAATGVSGRMCELICDKVAQHQQELGTLPDDAAQSVWRGRLAALVNSLRDEIDAARAPNGSPAWPTSEEQRRRNQRQLYFLKITVILAEMGELELLGQMHKVSFKRRIQILDEYLARPEATV
jgi:hypothetical protein